MTLTLEENSKNSRAIAREMAIFVEDMRLLKDAQLTKKVYDLPKNLPYRRVSEVAIPEGGYFKIYKTASREHEHLCLPDKEGYRVVICQCDTERGVLCYAVWSPRDYAQILSDIKSDPRRFLGGPELQTEKYAYQKRILDAIARFVLSENDPARRVLPSLGKEYRLPNGDKLEGRKIFDPVAMCRKYVEVWRLECVSGEVYEYTADEDAFGLVSGVLTAVLICEPERFLINKEESV